MRYDPPVGVFRPCVLALEHVVAESADFLRSISVAHDRISQ